MKIVKKDGHYVMEGATKQDFVAWAKRVIEDTRPGASYPLLGRYDIAMASGFDPKATALLEEHHTLGLRSCKIKEELAQYLKGRLG